MVIEQTGAVAQTHRWPDHHWRSSEVGEEEEEVVVGEIGEDLWSLVLHLLCVREQLVK